MPTVNLAAEYEAPQPVDLSAEFEYDVDKAVDDVIKASPVDKFIQEKTEGTWVGDARRTMAKGMLTKGGRIGDIAAAVVLPLAGATAGTFAMPVVGTAAGGATGSAAADRLVQARQMFRGERNEFSTGQTVAAGAIGAIVPGPIKAAASIPLTVAKTALVRGAQGAVLGGAQTALGDFIDEGKIDFGRVAEGAAWGSVFGAGFGSLEGSVGVFKTLQSKGRATPEEAIDALEQAAKNASDKEKAAYEKAKQVLENTRAARQADIEAAFEASPAQAEKAAALNAEGVMAKAAAEQPSPAAKSAEVLAEAKSPAEASAAVFEEAAVANKSPEAAAAVKEKLATQEATDYQYTVQQPQTFEGRQIPGYVQIDEIRGGQNTRSTNLETLRSEGVDLPDIPDNLPSGRYSISDIQSFGPGDGGLQSQAAFVSPAALMPLAGGASGAAYGFTQGDTPEERAANAVKYGLLGLGVSSVGSRLATGKGKYLDYVKELNKGTDAMPGWYLSFRQWEPIARLRELTVNPRARVKDVVASAPGQPGDAANPYAGGREFPGAVSARIKEEAESAIQAAVWNRDKSIDVLAKGTGTAPEALVKRLNEYMVAKTAKDYNRQNATFTQETGAPAAGIDDVEADAIVAAAKADGLETVFEDLRKQVRTIDDSIINVLVDGQLISKDQAAKLRQTYPEHVPLNRIQPDMDDASAVDSIFATPKFGVKSAGLKQAKGSVLEIDDIYTSVLTNLKDAIIRAERNKVGLQTAEFFRRHSVPGVKVTTPKVVGTSFDGAPMFAQPDTNTTLVARETPKGSPTAKQVWVEFDDPQLAKAFNGLNMEQTNGVLRVLGRATNLLGGLYTRFNPAFMFRNKLRDLQEAATIIATSGDLKAGVKVIGNSFSDMKAVADALSGKSTPDAQLYHEMAVNGGLTGGIASSMRDESGKTIAQMSGNRSIAKKSADWVVNAFDFLNAISEDSTRLSAYKQAKAAGATPKEAALAAREAGPDFNMKGSATKQLGTAYAFINPGIQGVVRAGKSVIRDPRTIAEVSAGLMGIGMAVDAWNSKVDPEWKKKKQMQFYRASGIPIILGDDAEGYYTLNIPVAQMLRPIKGLIDFSLDGLNGELDDPKAAAEQMVQILMDSSNPLGGQSVRQMATPTVADPLGDIVANESYAGSKVYPDKANPKDPDYTQVFMRTTDTASGQAAMGAARMLANMGIDVSPESLLYSVKGYSGGFGDIATGTTNLAQKVANPAAKVRGSDIPVVSGFVKYVRHDAPLAERSVDPELKDAVAGQAEDRLELRSEAYRTLNELQQLPPEQRKARVQSIVQRNPRMLDALANEFERRTTRPANDEIATIKALEVGNGARARFLLQKFKSMEPEQRRQYAQQLATAEILTDKVIDQMAALAAQRN